jgi:2'-hydroxyisoflavone reductase
MNADRRAFLRTLSAGAAAAAIGPSALGDLLRPQRELKLLILGGTGFLGPHIVRRAIERGHEITLFNRGKSGPEKFPDLEWLRGDRYGDLASLERAVEDGRQWDAVIDTFTYVPKTVTDAMDVLLPAMEQYVVLSTVSVYAEPLEPGMDESAPLNEIDDETAAAITTHRDVGAHYGAMKARVEAAAEGRFPGRVANIRPGLIVGPGDWTGRYTYWPVRASEGGTIAAPGTGDDFVQFIDARDLAEFTIRAIERDLTGQYNAISPAGEWTCRDMVESAVRSTDSDAEIEWVAADFLQEQQVRAWADMPVWVPNSAPGYAGQGLLSTRKAMAAGLDSRPIDRTAADTLVDYRDRLATAALERTEDEVAQAARQLRGGLSPERERALLEAWRARADTGTAAP